MNAPEAWREHYACVVRDIADSYVCDPDVRKEMVKDLLTNLDDSMITERVRLVPDTGQARLSDSSCRSLLRQVDEIRLLRVEPWEETNAEHIASVIERHALAASAVPAEPASPSGDTGQPASTKLCFAALQWAPTVGGLVNRCQGRAGHAGDHIPAAGRA